VLKFLGAQSLQLRWSRSAPRQPKVRAKLCTTLTTIPSQPEATLVRVNPSCNLPVVADHKMEPHQGPMRCHPKAPSIRVRCVVVVLTSSRARCELMTPVGPPDGQLLAERKASQSLPAPEVPILASDRPSPLRWWPCGSHSLSRCLRPASGLRWALLKRDAARADVVPVLDADAHVHVIPSSTCHSIVNGSAHGRACPLWGSAVCHFRSMT
jgi:hypothetical protein